MSVFISYSTKDSDFVNQLSAYLVKNKIQIWLDKWEMQPGDSLIDKIQQGLKDASYLIVVLSNNSVNSNWCHKELNSGLNREIQEDKIIVIPVLLKDCEIPLFLQEKLYADFRTDFDTGFKELIRPLSKLIKDNIGRTKKENTTTDYCIDWGIENDRFFMTIDLINWFDKIRKSILIQFDIRGNEKATERYLAQVKQGQNWFMKEAIISMLYMGKEYQELTMVAQSTEVQKFQIKNYDPKTNINFDTNIRVVLLGEEDGNDVVIHIHNFIQMLDESRSERISN